MFLKLYCYISRADLNNSVTRQTLRANNRALAQGLARLKLELRQERVVSMQLRAENQELKLDASRLRRLVGLKDEQIDEEVKKRMKVCCTSFLILNN